MPKLSSKHENQTTALLGDFTGGLNTAASEEFIEENQLAEVVNMEADMVSRKLYTVLGTKDLCSLDSKYGNIVYSFWDNINNHLLGFTDTGRILEISDDFSSINPIGKLANDDYTNISCVCWENGVLIANGGHIQYAKEQNQNIYQDVNGVPQHVSKGKDYIIENIESSPEKSYGIFARSGRVVVHDGNDNLLYSGVGDETNWKPDPNDPSTALFAEIGYKAGGKIISVTTNSTDIIILKDNGTCYKLSGEYPDWAISEVSRELYCSNVDGSCTLGNGNAMVLGNGILQNISTTQEYGDMKPSQMGQQVAAQIAALPEDTKLKYIASLNQVWFITKTQYVLVYDVGTGGFYQRWFNAPVNDVVSVGQTTYIIRPNKISTIDFNNGYCQDNGEPLIYEARFKTDLSLHNILVKRICVSVTPMIEYYDEADVTFTIGKANLKFPLKRKDNRLVQTIGITQKAKECEEPTIGNIYKAKKSVLVETRKMFRGDRVRLNLNGKGFPFTLNFITYDKVEV